ncbi:MAG: universal stress protein [Betaproteobacteria bacterium]|jgi:nucleotide-binding universal stress UspA family protein|nr:MAG: universal stress protein [Betaproteobacteria bacterium]TMH83588.1 MAG: universal stress protein [Betaproteobacteria bacterium]
MKILLAVDGSKHSLKAVKSLIEHADWYREKPAVELVNVHLPVPRIRGMSAVVGASQVRRYYDREGKAALSKARKLLDAAGIGYSPRILVGPVAETIVRQARLTRCELIMMGTRGMSAAANLFLGSCANRVVSISPIPVLLVK